MSSQLKLWDVGKREERDTKFLRGGQLPNELLAAHAFGINAVAFSPDGKTLASGGSDATIRLWDVATGERLAVLTDDPIPLSFYAVAFSPDGKALASGSGVQAAPRVRKVDGIPEVLEFPEFGEVKVWDLATRKARRLFRGEVGRIKSVCFSPDGKTLACGERTGAVRVFDVATGRQLAYLLEGHRDAEPVVLKMDETRYPSVRALVFSPDGKTLASAQHATEDNVKLWDLAAGRVRVRLKGHDGWVEALAFSPDGRVLVTACNVPADFPQKSAGPRCVVRLLDPDTGRPCGDPLPLDYQASSVSFGTRGRVLAVGGSRVTPEAPNGVGAITLWNLSPRGAAVP